MDYAIVLLGCITFIELCRLVVDVTHLGLKYCDTYHDPPIDDEILRRMYS